MAASLPTDPLAALGRAVRRLRLSKGYSQERFAELAGLHPRYVSDIERGRRNVGMTNLFRLSRALSMDLSALMASVEEELNAG